MQGFFYRLGDLYFVKKNKGLENFFSAEELAYFFL